MFILKMIQLNHDRETLGFAKASQIRVVLISYGEEILIYIGYDSKWPQDVRWTE